VLNCNKDDVKTFNGYTRIGTVTVNFKEIMKQKIFLNRHNMSICIYTRMLYCISFKINTNNNKTK
jgi:hypothetical protein